MFHDLLHFLFNIVNKFLLSECKNLVWNPAVGNTLLAAFIKSNCGTFLFFTVVETSLRGRRLRPLVSVCLAVNSRPVTLQRDRWAPCGRPRPSPPIVLERGGHWAESEPPSVQSQRPIQKNHLLVYVAARVALRVNYHTGANAAVQRSFTQVWRNSGFIKDF